MCNIRPVEWVTRGQLQPVLVQASMLTSYGAPPDQCYRRRREFGQQVGDLNPYLVDGFPCGHFSSTTKMEKLLYIVKNAK